jgi:soluble lytic murein transglycosylase-like protein
MSEDVVRRFDNEPKQLTQEGMLSAQPSPIETTGDPLDPRSSATIQKYGSTIKRYAETYGLDWRLILAVMRQESQFLPDARSVKGATGFMQIMPLTGEEVSRSLSIEDLDTPRDNIRGGIYYLRKLYDLFAGADEADRIKLALAAYNAGISRVYDAQELAAYLHDNPARWESIKDALPFLSKRFSTLHQSVWQQDKPKSGWFGSSRQTVAYVENIMEYYDYYRVALN